MSPRSARISRLRCAILQITLCLTLSARALSSLEPCDNGKNCFPNGFVTYNGFWIDSGTYIAWPYIQQSWPLYKSFAVNHFADIRTRFRARGIRLLVHPKLSWTHPNPALTRPGVTFPRPTSNESPDPASWGDIQKWRDILDTAKAANLEVYLVMLLPGEGSLSYVSKDPFILDDFYAMTNRRPDGSSCTQPSDPLVSDVCPPLRRNVSIYWNTFFNGVFGSLDSAGQNRAANLMYLDMMGSFSPRDPHHVAWFQTLWLTFTSSFSYIDKEKKIFNIMGNANAPNPATALANDIVNVRQMITSRGLPEPSKYSVDAYAAWSWVSSQGPDNVYSTMLTWASNAAGGNSRIIVEEIGFDHCPGALLNDGGEGGPGFSAFLGAASQGRWFIPIGISEYQDNESCAAGKLGLIKNDGTASAGAGVIPRWFGRNKASGF